jgi:ATP-dependent Clp protease ATP-binding subunit ClpA
MDSDGYVEKMGVVKFCTTSKQLAKDFQEMIWSLGAICRIREKTKYYTYKGEKRKGRLCYDLSIRHPDPKKLYRLKRKIDLLSSDYQYKNCLRNEIISIEKIGKMEAQCIMIDDPNHLYITDNYIVTHNTAIVEGICQRIVSGTVPKKLRNCKIFGLNMGALVAGTKYRGDFEIRIQNLLKTIIEDPNSILFIDEIHTIIGAGSASGSMDAANMLKPALARDLKCIGATTNSEYKKYFSGEGALERRFEKIDVDEPSHEQTKKILLGIRPRLEEFHNCFISDEAIDASISLSGRYLTTKFFPDKAIDCLDTACAKYVWKNESNPTVSANDVANIIGKQCQVPIEIITLDNNERIKNVEDTLNKRVMGQEHAVKSICRTLKNAYSGVRNPDKPIGIFVFGGQSGTGKT